MRKGIFIPESHTACATSCLVLERGHKVNPFIKKDDIVLCLTGIGARKNTIAGTAAFWCEEHQVYAVIRKDQIFPLGRKILIQRDVEAIEDHGFMIPGMYRTQSNLATVIRKGLHRGHFKVNGIEPGMKIQLTGWEPHMIQLKLENGKEGLIVNEEDILCAYEETPNLN